MPGKRLACLVLVLAVAGCGGGGGGEAPGEGRAPEAGAAPAREEGLLPLVLTPEQEEGKLVYETVCWTCHGNSGRGDGPAVQAGSVPRPPDFTRGDYPRLTGRQLRRRFEATLRGQDRSHPHMQYVASILQPETFESALAYIPVLGYPPEIPGSAIAGSQVYAFRCQGCHGPQGRGDGPVRGQLLVAPADFTRDTLIAARDFEGVFRRIKEGGREIHGSSMPAWGLLYKDGEVWDLVAYLATFQSGVLSPPPGGAELRR